MEKAKEDRIDCKAVDLCPSLTGSQPTEELSAHMHRRCDAHLRKLQQDPECPKRLDVSLDLSEASSLPETRQLSVVTTELKKIRSKASFDACAILASRPSLFGMMRMFEVLAEELSLVLSRLRPKPKRGFHRYSRKCRVPRVKALQDEIAKLRGANEGYLSHAFPFLLFACHPNLGCSKFLTDSPASEEENLVDGSSMSILQLS